MNQGILNALGLVAIVALWSIVFAAIAFGVDQIIMATPR